MQPNAKSTTNTYWLILLLLIITTLSTRLIGLNKGIWLDEFSSISVSINAPELLPALQNYDHPPLYFLLLHIWSRLGESELFLRLLSVSFAFLAQIVTYFWLKTYSKSAALIGLAFTITTPILLRYGQEIRHYQLLLLLTSAAFLFTRRIQQTPNEAHRRLYQWVSLTFALLVFVHLISVFVIPSVLIYLIAEQWFSEKKPNWKWLGLSILPAFLGFLFLYFVFLGDVSKSGDWWMPFPDGAILFDMAQALFGSDYLLAPLWRLSSVSQLLKNGSMFLLALVLLLFLILLMCGNWRKSLPLLLAGLAFYGAVYLFSVLFVPIMWDRTTLPGLVPLIGFLAVQLGSVRVARLRPFIPIPVITISALFVLGWLMTDATKPLEDWKIMGDLIYGEHSANSAVIIYPRYLKGPIFFYYPAYATDEQTYIPEFGNFETAVSTAISAQPSTLYVLTRHDASVNAYGDDFQKGLAQLSKSDLIYTRGIISLRKIEP